MEIMEKNEYFNSLPFPAPYVIQALDHYYGIKEIKEEVQEQPFMFKSNLSKDKKKRLKILLTTFWDHPHVGGLSKYLSTFQKGFESLGHQVDVISPNQCKNETYTDYSQVLRDFFTNRYGEYSERIVRNCNGLYRYERFLSEMDLEHYDILHAQDLFTANVLGRLNNWYKKPIFFTPHGSFTSSRLKFGKLISGSIEEAYFRCIEERAIFNARKVIMISDNFRAPLCEFGARKDQLIKVNTGIEWEYEEKKCENTDKIIITVISRLSPRKGHRYLLEALDKIKGSLPNVELRIVGDGVMRGNLEQQVQDLGLSNVYFYGVRSDIPELLRQSDIYVLPTINDNMPISVIEAMFGEQAIITTNCGGIPEIIQDQQTGFVVDPGNVNELADRLLLLISSRELRKALAEKAKSYAHQHLTAEIMVKGILAGYESF
ncbi:glycosyltransferase family 4 protein [Jeotgalibacillus soli]|uniref:Glycosyl transferase family 1 n=1 Tax=Jeotgalibacillus soli TaxID=889306 RepID=A0A0C2S7S2_9BACL|nr:glycosyltransferase family 4 protein [Jeotgalibacillus soli]KIL50039.1 glycosyl transferase family 1 [Jeotgalibacillus soli]